MYPNSSKTTKVTIEPFCILCGNETNHVEEWKSTSISTSRIGTKSYTDTRREVIPYPVHPECLLKMKNKARLWGILIAVAGIIVLCGGGFLVYSVLQKSAPGWYSTIALFGPMLVGYLITGSQGEDKLAKLVKNYYLTHMVKD